MINALVLRNKTVLGSGWSAQCRKAAWRMRLCCLFSLKDDIKRFPVAPVTTEGHIYALPMRAGQGVGPSGVSAYPATNRHFHRSVGCAEYSM